MAWKGRLWSVNALKGGIEDGLKSLPFKRFQIIAFQTVSNLCSRYVEGPTKAKTEVIMNNNDPEWNETLYVLVDDITARKLTINIMDSDEGDLGSDDVIGATTMTLTDLEPNEPKDVWLEFPETAKKNAKGKKPPMTANVEITYIPFDVQGGGESSLAGIGRLWVHSLVHSFLFMTVCS